MLERITLDPIEPTADMTDDEVLVACGCCPGCEMQTSFRPDDERGTPGRLTCTYCGTSFLLDVIEAGMDRRTARARVPRDDPGRRLLGVQDRRGREPEGPVRERRDRLRQMRQRWRDGVGRG